MLCQREFCGITNKDKRLWIAGFSRSATQQAAQKNLDVKDSA